MTTHIVTRPQPAVDPAVEEMLHSLLDGRAKHRYVSDHDARQDNPRARITLATTAQDFSR